MRPDELPWRTPEELVELGFWRSRVLIMNEAHDGPLRCVRTREIGRCILPTAHDLGVRHLAMEALLPLGLIEDSNRSRKLPASSGYLEQPEMRAFIQAALDLGWTLIGYEAFLYQDPPADDPMSHEFTNWREEQQARNLIRALGALPDAAKLLVWCGNAHGSKMPVPMGRWTWGPMGWHLRELSALDPFVIDQSSTVGFRKSGAAMARYLRRLAPTLSRLGGTAGFLVDEAPDQWCQPGVDGVLLSVRNDLE